MKQVQNSDIVLPSDYSKVFKKFAQELDVDIDHEEVILQNLRNDKKRLDKIIKETNRNLQELNDSAKTAQKAIETKDVVALQGVKESIASMEQKIMFLQHELFTDSLTKANNRKWLTDFYLKDDHFQSDGSLAFIDVNNFKMINDTYGHLIGDLVLRYLSDYLKQELDFLGRHVVRYAGDEFIVLFDSKDKKINFNLKMQEIQKRLLKKVLKPKNNTHLNLSLSFSYGVVDFKLDDSFSDAISIADERMYENKKRVKSSA